MGCLLVTEDFFAWKMRGPLMVSQYHRCTLVSASARVEGNLAWLLSQVDAIVGLPCVVGRQPCKGLFFLEEKITSHGFSAACVTIRRADCLATTIFRCCFAIFVSFERSASSLPLQAAISMLF